MVVDLAWGGALVNVAAIRGSYFEEAGNCPTNEEDSKFSGWGGQSLVKRSGQGYSSVNKRQQKGVNILKVVIITLLTN
jgi:hypothetical protein